jgi:hypothetical protein
MCNCGTSCKCETKCGIKRCTLPKDVISVEKNLLNLCFIEDGYTSGPDFCATFEIIIINQTANRIKNISIIDSLMGLSALSSSDNPTGGELRPHYTNVQVIGGSTTLVPLSFDDIVANGGELLDVANSYLDACAIANIRVRIAGNGILMSMDPNAPAPEHTGTERFKYTSMIQNSAMIKGDVMINNTEVVKMFPVYVKSGVFTSAITTVYNDYYD